MYTGNPCPYCVYARALLDSKKIPYQEINVWEDESKRAEMLKKSGGRTSRATSRADRASAERSPP